MKIVSGVLLLFNLIFAPYLYGASAQLFIGVCSITIALALFIYLTGVFFKYCRFYGVVGWLPLCLFLLLPLFQLIPLPPLLVEAISPATYQLYEPLLAQDSQKHWITLSVDPKRTLQVFFLFFGCFCTYVLSHQFFSHRRTIKRNISWVVFFISFIALVTLIICTLNPWEYSIQFLAPMFLVSPVAFTLFLYYKPVVSNKNSLVVDVQLLYKEPGFHKYLFYLGSCVLLVLALIAALKWSAAFSLYVTVIVFLFFYSLKFTGSVRLVLVFFVLLIGAVIAGYIWEEWFSYVQKAFDSSAVAVEGVPELLLASFETVKVSPLFGTGLGSYDQVSPYLATRLAGHTLPSIQPYILQLFLEVGLVGVALLLLFFLSVYLSIWKMVKKRGDRFVTLVGIGALSGLVTFLLHSFTFPVHYSGDAGLYLAGFMGATVATVHCRFNYYEPESYCKEASLPFRVVLGVVLFLVSTIALIFFGCSFYAHYLYGTTKFSAEDEVLAPIQRKVEHDTLVVANKFDPLESLYSLDLGRLESGLGNEKNATRYLIMSGLRNVMDGQVFQELALIGDKTDEDRLALMELGYKRSPFTKGLGERYGQLLFDRGKREDALELAGEMISYGSNMADSWLPLLYRNNISRKELVELLPPSVELWLHLARLSEKNADRYNADFYYEGALNLCGKNDFVDPVWFLTIFDYYKRQNRDEMAVLVVRRAITLTTDEAVFHRLLGDYYLKENIRYRAIEEYEQAVLLDPEDVLAGQQLQQLRKRKEK